MRPRIPRAVTLVTGVAVAATTVAGLAVPAGASANGSHAARQGARWLAGELTHGLVHNAQYDFDDYGLTIDTALVLDATGHHRKARHVAKRLAPHIAGSAGYTQADEYDSEPPYALVQRGHYASATAKALVLAQVTERNVHRYGGVDLVADLEDRVTASGPSRGRIADDSSYGDFANTLGQAYAARALSTADSERANEVVRFLLEQQCRQGYFRTYFTADSSAAAQDCDRADGEPDVDTTALAAIQLAAIDDAPRRVRAAVADARSWLRKHQRRSGAWVGTGSGGANANSTGLAAWALGDSAAGRKAARWLRKLQVRDAGSCRTRLSGEKGAVAFDRKAYRDGRRHGITTTTSDQWRRASTQAVYALQFLDGADGRLRLAGPKGTLRSGSKVRLRIRNVAPFSKVCVSRGSKHRQAKSWTIGRSGDGNRTVRVHGHGRQVWTVVDSEGRRARLVLRVR